MTSHGPEAGQKQEKNGPGRHFASSYSTRARDLAKDMCESASLQSCLYHDSTLLNVQIIFIFHDLIIQYIHVQ